MPRRQKQHPSDELLLMYFDGELAASKRERVREHIEGCWGCRTRFDDLSRVVSTIVHASQLRLQSFAEEPPAPWPSLNSKLESLEHGVLRRSLVQRIRLEFPRLTAAIPIAAGLAALTLAFLYLAHAPAVVSAKEILQRSALSTQKDLRSIPRAVLHQRIRVRRKPSAPFQETSADYEIWRSASGAGRTQTKLSNTKTMLANTDGDSSLQSDFRKVCRENAFDWEAPLSAESYVHWHDSIRAFSDAVSQGEHAILTTTVASASGADEIHRAELVLRPADWHPVELKLVLADREFDISEISYEVVDEAKLDPTIFGARLATSTPSVSPSPEKRTHVPPAPEPAIATPAGPTAAETELAVVWQLHQFGADLGDPIVVFCCSGGDVVVQALGVSDDRRSQLEELAGQFPNVVLDFSGAIQHTSPPVAALPDEQLVQGPTDPGKGSLQESITKYFGSSGAQEHYTRELLQQLEPLMNRAYALRALAVRWNPAEEPTLTSQDRIRLHQLVVDHVAAARAPCGRRRRHVDTFNEEFRCC